MTLDTNKLAERLAALPSNDLLRLAATFSCLAHGGGEKSRETWTDHLRAILHANSILPSPDDAVTAERDALRAKAEKYDRAVELAKKSKAEWHKYFSVQEQAIEDAEYASQQVSNYILDLPPDHDGAEPLKHDSSCVVQSPAGSKTAVETTKQHVGVSNATKGVDVPTRPEDAGGESGFRPPMSQPAPSAPAKDVLERVGELRAALEEQLRFANNNSYLESAIEELDAKFPDLAVKAEVKSCAP